MYNKKIIKLIIVLMFSASYNSVSLYYNFNQCAIADEFDNEDFANVETHQHTIWDPLESINRKILIFNWLIWKYVVIPANEAYNKYIPNEIQSGIFNFSRNYVSMPTTFMVSIGDMDIDGALITFWRFTLNTTFGLFGIFDIAKDLGLLSQDKSFSNLLQFYHIPHGPYIMLPILGPSNVRDTIGWSLDLLADPWNATLVFGVPLIPTYAYLSYTNPFIFATNRSYNSAIFIASQTKTLQILTKMQHSAEMLDTIFKAYSFGDPYMFFKTMYIQSLYNMDEHYLSYRKSYKFPSNKKNKCLNTFSVEEDEECNIDVKTYEFSF